MSRGSRDSRYADWRSIDKASKIAPPLQTISESVRRRILGATDKSGKLVAAIFCVWDQKSYFYIMSMREESSDKGAISLLIWEAIQDAVNRNLTFDFTGLSTQPISITPSAPNSSCSSSPSWKNTSHPAARTSSSSITTPSTAISSTPRPPSPAGTPKPSPTIPPSSASAPTPKIPS